MRPAGGGVQLPQPQGGAGAAGQAEEEGGAGGCSGQASGFPQTETARGGACKGASCKCGCTTHLKSKEDSFVHSFPSQQSLLVLLVSCKELEGRAFEAAFSRLWDQSGVAHRQLGGALPAGEDAAESLPPALQVKSREIKRSNLVNFSPPQERPESFAARSRLPQTAQPAPSFSTTEHQRPADEK